MTTFRKNDLLTITGISREILNTWIKRIKDYGMVLDGSQRDDENEIRRWGEYTEHDVMYLLAVKALLNLNINFKDAVDTAKRGDYSHGLSGRAGGPYLIYRLAYEVEFINNPSFSISTTPSLSDSNHVLNGGQMMEPLGDEAEIRVGAAVLDLGALSEIARRRLELAWGEDEINLSDKDGK